MADRPRTEKKYEFITTQNVNSNNNDRINQNIHTDIGQCEYTNARYEKKNIVNDWKCLLWCNNNDTKQYYNLLQIFSVVVVTVRDMQTKRTDFVVFLFCFIWYNLNRLRWLSFRIFHVFVDVVEYYSCCCCWIVLRY